MPIIAGAIVPHSPILIPSIGKRVANQISRTAKSISTIADSLEKLSLDTMIILTTPDSTKAPHMLTIQQRELYKVSFEEFGDFITQSDVKCDTVLGLSLKKGLEEKGFPVTFASQEKLDYSASVPLVLLRALNTKVIVVQPPDISLASLMKYGAAIQHTLQESDKRIAVIASGDLSHSLTETAPLGLKMEGTVIDQDIISLLRSRRFPIRKIRSFSKEAAFRTGVCGLDAFVLLVGILHHMNIGAHFHSYEGPLGVGYCVISYAFH